MLSSPQLTEQEASLDEVLRGLIMKDTDEDIYLPDLEPYFPGHGQRVLELLRAVPALSVSAEFLGRVMQVFDDFRRSHGSQLNASDLRLRLNRLICRLVMTITDADCVFIRRLRIDGSVQLYGEPVWSSKNRLGDPPIDKQRNEGVSGRILNSGNMTPVVIGNILDQDNPYAADHQKTLEAQAPESSAYTFVRSIRAETCVPLTLDEQVLAGIVGIRWQPYDPNDESRVRQSLKVWQDVFALLYYVGYQLELTEELQGRISALTNTLTSWLAPSNDQQFLQQIVTILTCNAGFRWHRAFLFLFDGPYPATARCQIAMGGTGSPAWAKKQQSLADLTLDQSLLFTERVGFAQDDNLYQLSILRPERMVIPKDVFPKHPMLHRVLSGDKAVNLSLTDGLFVIDDDDWLMQFAWSNLVFATDVSGSRRYVCPLLHPISRTCIGIMLLDNPYPRPWEMTLTLSASGTRLICDGYAWQLAARMPLNAFERHAQSDQILNLKARDLKSKVNSLVRESLEIIDGVRLPIDE